MKTAYGNILHWWWLELISPENGERQWGHVIRNIKSPYNIRVQNHKMFQLHSPVVLKWLKLHEEHAISAEKRIMAASLSSKQIYILDKMFLFLYYQFCCFLTRTILQSSSGLHGLRMVSQYWFLVLGMKTNHSVFKILKRQCSNVCQNTCRSIHKSCMPCMSSINAEKTKNLQPK